MKCRLQAVGMIWFFAVFLRVTALTANADLPIFNDMNGKGVAFDQDTRLGLNLSSELDEKFSALIQANPAKRVATPQELKALLGDDLHLIGYLGLKDVDSSVRVLYELNN